MRSLRTVPHFWRLCEDVMRHCPNAILLQFVNPMQFTAGRLHKVYRAFVSRGSATPFKGQQGNLRVIQLFRSNASVTFARGSIVAHVAPFLRFEERLADGAAAVSVQVC